MLDKRLIESALELIGDPEEFHARHNQFDANMRFWLASLEAWRKQYPNQWIAVYNGELGAVAETEEGLLKAIEEKSLPLEDLIIDFLEDPRPIFVL